jgi:hypothetical protein
MDQGRLGRLMAAEVRFLRSREIKAEAGKINEKIM